MPHHTPHPSAAFCASVVAEAIGACMVAFVVSWVIGTGHRASLSQEAGAWHAVAQGDTEIIVSESNRNLKQNLYHLNEIITTGKIV